MARKKNPEQETPTEEEQQELETPEEEIPAQEEQPREESDQEQEELEEQDPEEEEPEEDHQEERPQEQQPETPAQEQSAADEVADLRRQLLEARGQNAAYAAGVAPGMVDDAVTLAMAEAAKAGEVTEAAVAKAMEAVLKRHPEWKASGSDKPKGGFKLGADRDSGGSYKKQNANAPQNVKRWNRFK